MSNDLRIALDITRLIRRSTHATPTGVDRVELAYAEHFSARYDVSFMAQLSSLMRIASRAEAARVIGDSGRRWNGGTAGADETAPLAPLVDWLSRPALARGRPRHVTAAKPAFAMEPYLRFARLLVANRRPRMLDRHSKPCIYLNVGQQNLNYPAAFAWLSELKIPAIFFIHDLIPIEFPELCSPTERVSHVTRMVTARRHAQALIVNSRATEQSVQRYWQAQGWGTPHTHVVPLGIATQFRQARRVAGRPYFVVLGTIGRRKNQLMLAKVWRDLMIEMGNETPHLVMVGQRGWENGPVSHFLDQTQGLRNYVIEQHDLGDRHLIQLLAGARALLMPSLAEGYGLPLAEALASGVPVVASDIPAHREVGGALADYAPPLDRERWKQAVLNRIAPNGIAESVRTKLDDYRPPNWTEHFDAVSKIIARYARLPANI